jgi:mRNA interferase MazF
MDLVSFPRRDEVWLVALDPTLGSEMQKTRPCLVVSPDEANEALRTVIVAPMTTSERAYPTRVSLTFQGKQGQVALDQLRAVDRTRLVRPLGRVSAKTATAVSGILVEMFARGEATQRLYATTSKTKIRTP